MTIMVGDYYSTRRLAVYALRSITNADDAWLHQLNAATMREYAEQTYGPWDEAAARRIFASRWDLSAMRIIVVEDEDAGLLDLRRRPDGLEVAQIKILPAFQRRGLGTAVLTDILSDVQQQRQSVVLRVLKVNPARRLYEHLGFVVTGETATHYLMAARPNPAAPGPPPPE